MSNTNKCRPQARTAANKHPLSSSKKRAIRTNPLRREHRFWFRTKNNPDNPTENGTTFIRTRIAALDAGATAEAANKRANVEQQKMNIIYQHIVYVNFEGARPRLAAFANAMIRLTHQRDSISVREIAMINGFYIKPKKREASKLLTPEKIKQEFQKCKVKVHSNNHNSQE